jgi:tetratricopeptide (TPR) repeat protein
MPAQDKKWILRDSSGHIYGPFTISKLGELITKGIVTGEEDVAAYPAGEWRPLSSERELYDVVIAMISQSRAPRRTAKIQPTVSKAAEQVNLKKETVREEVPLAKAEIKSRVLAPKQAFSETDGTQDRPSVRPLTDTEQVSVDDDVENDHSSDKKKYIPLLFLIAAGLLFFVALASNSKKSILQPPLKLIAPKLKKVSGDLNKSQAFVRQAWPYFNSDVVSNYITAEELYVRAVEEYPMNSDALSMLLMTDMQLWPLAKQDGADQNILQDILQQLSKSDLYGPKRALGSAIVDLTLARDASARSQISSSLIAQPGDGRLYDLKAQMFFQNSEYEQAISYFEQTATLLPTWVYPIHMLGYCYGKLGNVNVAQQYYLRALKMNPGHVNSRLELGVLEIRYFGHAARAKEYLQAALNSGERFVTSVEARGRYALALAYNTLGDRKLSKAEAEKALTLNPSDPDVREFLSRIGVTLSEKETSINDKDRIALGDQYMRSANYLGAQAQYKAAFSANPKNARAALRAAEALWKLHDYNDTVSYLQKSIQADSKFIESYVMLADIKSQRYDFEAATKALEGALKVDPRNFEIYRGYAELFLRRADPASAEQYANRALQLFETDVNLNEIMSRIQVARKNNIKGMQYAKRAVELDKNSASAQVNYAKVKAAYQGARDAAEYIKNLIDTYPNELSYRVGFAEILMQDDEYAEARQILTQVISADEKNKEAYMLLGDIGFLTNQLDEALTSFLSAARIDPSDPTALFRAGEIYLKAGKATEAQKQFQLVLRTAPLFPKAHFNLAKTYQSLGLVDLALKELDEEKRLNPRLADPYEYAGDLFMTSRNYSLATKNYQKASEIKPQEAAIFVKLARAYRGQGYNDASIAMLNLAKAKESGLSEIYKELGITYESKGMGREARLEYGTYLNLEPNAADKAIILGKIQELGE